MTARRAYLLLCVLGLVLPYSQLIPWVWQHGFEPAGFIAAMFANRISTFFVLDVIVSAGALFVLVLSEGTRAGVRFLWAPIVATLLVGVSLGLPLFLYLRETRTANGAR
jgi:hypothetical protein